MTFHCAKTQFSALPQQTTIRKRRVHLNSFLAPQGHPRARGKRKSVTSRETAKLLIENFNFRPVSVDL